MKIPQTTINVSHNRYMSLLSVMVFNATFSNILDISWQSVSLLEETGLPVENHWPVTSRWQTVSHNVASSTPSH